MRSGLVWRGWLRSCLKPSLRTLMVVVALLGAGMGLILDQVRLKDEAIARIKQGGGWLLASDRSLVALPDRSAGWLFSPRRLLETWRELVLDDVREVVIGSKTRPSEWLPLLARFRNLKGLNATGAGLTDGDLRSIAQVGGLTMLTLKDNPISDAGLAYLAPLDQLDTLWLDRTNVTGAGLADLARMKNLIQLSLGDTRVTDSGLDFLRTFDQLYSLNLQGTLITDAGLARLNRLRYLYCLDLESTRITGAGLKTLRTLPRLGILDLERTAIDDRGLRSLGGLPSLHQLWLGSTPFSTGAVAEFKDANPHVQTPL